MFRLAMGRTQDPLPDDLDLDFFCRHYYEKGLASVTREVQSIHI